MIAGEVSSLGSINKDWLGLTRVDSLCIVPTNSNYSASGSTKGVKKERKEAI